MRKGKYLIGLLVVAVALMVLASGCGAAGTPAAAAAPEVQPGITVVGMGQVNAAPDMATINLGVETTGDTANSALEQNAAKMSQVIEKLKALGIAEKDIQTSGVNVSPVYNHDVRITPSAPDQGSQSPAITGYTASNRVTVIINDLDQAANVLDGVVSVGANSVSGLQFGIKDDSKLREQALAEAVKQTQGKAKAIADAMGVSVGGVISAQESSAAVPVAMPMAADMALRSAATPISPGELMVMAQVQITYSFQ